MFEVKNSNKLDSQVYRDSLIIREDVFVKEQGVPIEIEIECEEGPKYYCGYVDGNFVTCARVKIEDGGVWHIQRVATLKDSRGKGYSSSLLRNIEEDARKAKVPYLTLGAQDTAQAFYKKLGYEVVGEGFLDAEMPHHRMDKKLV